MPEASELSNTDACLVFAHTISTTNRACGLIYLSESGLFFDAAAAAAIGDERDDDARNFESDDDGGGGWGLLL